jgi:hypothetical protein
VSTIEEMLGKKSSGSGLENREYDHGDPLRWLRDTLYRQKLALISSTSGGRSVGIVCSWTKATELVFMNHTAIYRTLQRWPSAVIPSSRHFPYLWSMGCKRKVEFSP